MYVSSAAVDGGDLVLKLHNTPLTCPEAWTNRPRIAAFRNWVFAEMAAADPAWQAERLSA